MRVGEKQKEAHKGHRSLVRLALPPLACSIRKSNQDRFNARIMSRRTKMHNLGTRQPRYMLSSFSAFRKYRSSIS
jgi:hypothetical protein